MAELAELDRTYRAIMEAIVHRGTPPHFTELAHALGMMRIMSTPRHRERRSGHYVDRDRPSRGVRGTAPGGDAR